MVRFLLWSSGECGVTSSLPLLPGPLLLRMVPSMDQKDQFEIISKMILI